MSTSTPTRVAVAALQQAFDTLARYNRGSGRDTLKPIDDAAMAAAADAGLRADIQGRLVATLRSPASAVAKEYACGRLALIGGPEAVPALADLLPNTDLAHPATDALQRMTCDEAVRALRENLPKLAGLPLTGVITALGARRDLASVGALTALLSNTDAAVASAAAAALGEIGSPAAATALRELLTKAPPAWNGVLADACLLCARRLDASGNPAEARAIADALLSAGLASYVRDAIKGLDLQ
ncbi:MAG TPA: HEAT repeat domain-containing protein [Candidatus Paceibacterota bacterium]|nr:HEAT repeat domain-containing protein [Candidatus Paceibacterota bacterium]